MTLFVGRGRSEKVTVESSFATIEGPTPFTRLNPSIEPNGPRESRSATIRFASAGPIYRRPSISFTLATSRSTGPTGLGGAFCFGSRFGRIGGFYLGLEGRPGSGVDWRTTVESPKSPGRRAQHENYREKEERLPLGGGWHDPTTLAAADWATLPKRRDSAHTVPWRS